MSALIDDRYRAAMNRVAQVLDANFNPVLGEKKIGFVLLIAEFGMIEGGRVNYINNGDRADMIAMMKEYIARAEGRYVAPEQAGKQ